MTKKIPSKRGKSPKKEVTMTQAVVVGLNVYQNCHADEGFDISTVCILKQGYRFQLDDYVVVYFCFPCLGVAVPLCPGEVLIFNTLEDHCIISIVSIYERLYCI